jgi:hypothetical protein
MEAKTDPVSATKKGEQKPQQYLTGWVERSAALKIVIIIIQALKDD